MSEIDEYYSKIYKSLNPIGMVKAYYLKRFYGDRINKYADISENGIKDFSYLFGIPSIAQIYDKKYFSSRKQHVREFKNLIKDSYPEEITEAGTIKVVNGYLLNESLACLNRSIYWLLNYYRNIDGYSLNSKLQNLYYSEFFIHLSIARYLGLAYTWISKLSLPIKTQILKISSDSSKTYEENMKISVF